MKMLELLELIEDTTNQTGLVFELCYDKQFKYNLKSTFGSYPTNSKLELQGFLYGVMNVHARAKSIKY